ncbi:laccase 1 [Cristinia sonorae]|uniref:laccase n=1 Tax=Cristinia sonorae TaxID=1940300 RepID=A0A8K0URW6_9AGAR|nr:laccase 1 [Cristinia sonorae]
MTRLNTIHSVIPLVFALGASAAIGPVADLEIVNAQINPDGQFPREAVLAGGTFPGPLITGNKGDQFQINVIDKLTQASMLKSTSIHWHGFFQRGTNWADGGAFVNQCPISPGESFLYQFQSADQAGTFWYHSHLSTQYCDGLRGPIVVYDPHDPHADLYDVDDENTIITLADWYHCLARQGPKFPTADATLINGVGRAKLGNPIPFSIITVQSNKRYRFRLINMACDPGYQFSIDKHDLTIIEVDGVNHEAHTVDSLDIFAVQRYSFVLKANQPVGNYWIRANPNVGNSGFEGGINSAVLKYVGAPDADPPIPTETGTKPLKEQDLHPLEDPGAPGQAVVGGVDYALNLLFNFMGASGTFAVNNRTFESPSVPVMLQILSGASRPQDLLPADSIFPLPHNATIELSMPAGVLGGPHPFHLHGHVFDVVRSAGSDAYNYKSPVRRDVVNIGALGDNVTIRFRTDNPGPWFLHCHIDWHLEAGLAIIFAEDVPNAAAANPAPPAWNDLCPKYNALDSSDH